MISKFHWYKGLDALSPRPVLARDFGPPARAGCFGFVAFLKWLLKKPQQRGFSRGKSEQSLLPAAAAARASDPHTVSIATNYSGMDIALAAYGLGIPKPLRYGADSLNNIFVRLRL